MDADPRETFSPQEKAPVPSHVRNRSLFFLLCERGYSPAGRVGAYRIRPPNVSGRKRRPRHSSPFAPEYIGGKYVFAPFIFTRMRDACQFTRIRPVPGRLVGVYFCALHGYGIDTCIFETSRTGYEMDTYRFTCICPVPGRLKGVCDTPLHGYGIDTCIFETSRTGYGMDTYQFTRIRLVPGRLEGVFFCALHGYMKNLCRSAGNVFTSRKSPGPFACKESGLGFLLCERG